MHSSTLKSNLGIFTAATLFLGADNAQAGFESSKKLTLPKLNASESSQSIPTNSLQQLRNQLRGKIGISGDEVFGDLELCKNRIEETLIVIFKHDAELEKSFLSGKLPMHFTFDSPYSHKWKTEFNISNSQVIRDGKKQPAIAFQLNMDQSDISARICGPVAMHLFFLYELQIMPEIRPSQQTIAQQVDNASKRATQRLERLVESVRKSENEAGQTNSTDNKYTPWLEGALKIFQSRK